MPQILLAGAPTGCWTNLGDEAILAAMTETIRGQIPDATIAVVSSNPHGFLDQYGCKAVDFRNIEGLIAAVESSDLLALGGGSIFFDYWGANPEAVLTPAHQGLELWAGLALIAAATDTPTITYGVGVGPLGSNAGQLLAAATLEQAILVTVRDYASLRTVASLGVDHPDIQVTGDPVVRLVEPQPADGAASTRLLGVALRQWDIGVDEGRWQIKVARALETALATTGAHARFVPMHKSVNWPLSNDLGAAETVIRLLPQELQNRCSTISDEVGWRDRLGLLAGCDSILAMRYHAALVGICAERTPVALCYDPKVSSLMTDAGLAELSFPLDERLDSGRLGEAIISALEPENRLRSSLGAVAAQLVERESCTAYRAAEVLGFGPASRRLGQRMSRLVGMLAEQHTHERSERTQALIRQLHNSLEGASARRASIPGDFPKPAGPGPDTDPETCPGTDPGTDLAAEQPVSTSRALSVGILTNRLLDRTSGEPCAGGAERYALDLATLLSDLGLSVVFFQKGGNWEVGTFHGFEVRALPEGGAEGELEVGVTDRFCEATAGFDRQIVLSPNYGIGPLRDDAIVVSHGVWWDHDFWPHLDLRTPEWAARIEALFASGRRMVSVDENTVDVVRSMLPGATENITVIPNYVDTKVFHPAERRSGSPVPHVLIPRRAEAIRGAGLVGPVLELVPDPCTVTWAGDGDPAMLTALTDVAQHDERLNVSSFALTDMAQLYRDADIVIIPTVASEGQSLSCLEAMAAGCAVIATRVGGLGELITDGVDGLLCDPEPRSIAAALRRAVRDPALRARLGTEARRTAMRHDVLVWRDRWARLLEEEGWIDSVSRAVGYDIFCFSIIDWEFRKQRPQQMMEAWAKRGRRVFYLRVSEFLGPDQSEFTATSVGEGIWEITLRIPAFDVYSGEVPSDVATSGVSAIRSLIEHFGITSAVSVVELATWCGLATGAREEFGWPIVYDCMDDWNTFPGFDARPSFLEEEERLVDRADIMVVSSETILRRWISARPDLVLARNASDFDFFSNWSGVDPLPGVAGPVAGFFGAVVEWFDVALMRRVALDHPGVTFVFVGNVARVDISSLKSLPNVRFEGLQPYEMMPAYLSRFDVCLIPFVTGGATDGMDVVKFYEYVSQGKPVVSTRIREIVAYESLLYLADGPQEFSEMVGLALDEQDPEKAAQRVQLARLNTWDDRVEVVDAEILRCLTSAPRRTGKSGGDLQEAPEEHGTAERGSDLAEQNQVLRDRLDALDRSRPMRLVRAYWRMKSFLSPRKRR